MRKDPQKAKYTKKAKQIYKMLDKLPAFEIYDWKNDKHYKIYVSGYVTGFEKHTIEVTNRIPRIISKAVK